MNSFEDRLTNYPSLLESYTKARIIARENSLKGDDLDHHLSKYCMAWFFENHLRVEREASDQELRQVTASPIVPFIMSDVQLGILDKFTLRMKEKKKFRHRVMKCRRARVSTIYLAISYHLARFNESKKGLIFCDRLETARKLRRILEIFYQSDDLKDKPTEGRKTLGEGLYLHPTKIAKEINDRDSFILLGSGEQKNAGVGGSLDWLVWSEAALTSDAEIHMTTISPSLQGALFDVAESTPSLVGQDAIIYPEFEHPSENCDLMFVSWLDIKEYRIDDEEKVKNYIPYNDHNLYGKEEEIINDRKVSVQQMLWRRLKLDELKNLNSFRQVFPIDKEEAFYSSAGLFFHKTLMEMTKPKVLLQSKQYLFSDQGAEIAAILDPTGPWKIYEPTIIDRGYLIAVDIAEGKCADKESRDPDYSVATVFKLNPVIEEVAFFRERIPPEILAEQVAIAAKYYNGAFVVPERNGPGLAFLVRILQIYNNVYQQQKFINGSFVMTQEYGFQTTSTTKVHALSCLLSRIRDKDKGLTLHTDIFRNEMARYVQQGMKYGALPGFHDDTITVLWLMAVSIGQSPNMIRPRDSDGQPPPNMRTYEPKIQRDDWAVNLGKPYYAK